MAKKADVTYATIKAAIAHQFVRGEITWEELKATSVILDYYSLNQYIDLDPFSFSDTTAFAFSKTEAETLALSDTQQLSLQKQLSETLSVSDNVSIILVIQRAFADSSAISDVAVLAVEKGLTETLSVSEILSMAVSLSKVDATSLSDTQSLIAEKPLSDSLSVAESFSRVATYSRAFTDAFSLDDLETHTNTAILNKTNVFGFNDSFTHVLERQNHAVLNTSALNTFTFNS
jgi:hypothetical protein